jgi:ATP-dependent Clp protease adapter protein ClpS
MMPHALILVVLISILCFYSDAFRPLPNTRTAAARTHKRLMSTVISPPKVDRTTKKGPKIEPQIPDFLFKENRDVQKEFEDYIDENKFYVILYNDPFNKRVYVQQALMDVMSMSETVAQDVMMQAHTYGFAVAGEWVKEVAEDYAKKLVEKGLVAEAKSSKEPEGAGDSQ